MMEPPAKRLRILQSVEVDDTNLEYIAAKEKQRQKLKGRFEGIFSKFEAIPEAMSDEIDMRTGEIVVDRGHMRKLERQYRREKRLGQSQMLDDFIANVDGSSDQEESEKEKEDVRDELAPSLSPEPRSRKQVKSSESVQTTVLKPPLPTPVSQKTDVSIPVLDTPAPATNIMQLMQFVQTPPGQLAQTPFMAQITQAIQQAIAPILSPVLSTMLTNTTGMHDTNTLPIPTVPVAIDTLKATPTEPASHFSASIDSPNLSTATLSSPVPAISQNSDRRRARLKRVYTKPRRNIYTRKDAPLPAPYNAKDDVESLSSVAHKTSSPAASHHLPTPSSLQHHDPKDGYGEAHEHIPEDIEETIASGAHYDEDERDLLSLAGADAEDLDETPPDSSNLPKADSFDLGETTFEAEECDLILPSVESGRFTEEPMQELDQAIEQSTEPVTIKPTPSKAAPKLIISSTIKKTKSIQAVDRPTETITIESTTPLKAAPAPMSLSTTKKHKSRLPIKFRVDSDTEDEPDFVHVDFNTPQKPSKKITTTKRQRNNHTSPPPPNSDLSPQSTPHIKRESCTPPPTLLLATPVLKTPLSAFQPKTLSSSATNSNSSKMTRSAFLRKVKQSWASRGRKSTPGSKASSRKGFQSAGRKRGWEEVEGSGDELAI